MINACTCLVAACGRERTELNQKETDVFGRGAATMSKLLHRYSDRVDTQISSVCSIVQFNESLRRFCSKYNGSVTRCRAYLLGY